MKIVRCDECGSDFVPAEPPPDTAWTQYLFVSNATIDGPLTKIEIRRNAEESTADLCMKCLNKTIADAIIGTAKHILDTRNAA